MDFEWSESQRSWHDAAVEFARRELGRDVAARDREQAFDRAAWRRAADFGVLGMPVPKEYGGLGLGLLDLLAAMEGLGYGGKDAGLIFSVNAHLWTNTLPILRFGDEAQRRRWLPGLADGSLIGANGASEPDAGSDVFALRTRAERRGDAYVLTGTKTFVTNAPVADLFVTYATIDPKLGALGVTAFLVERGARGLSVGRPIEKMGLRTSPMAEVVLEGVEVPAAQRLGREGRGVEVFECSMEWERGCILAWNLGALERLLETSVAFVRQRRQFGKPISQFQSVSNRLVDMKVRLEAARLLLYRAAWAKSKNESSGPATAIAKLFLSEAMVSSGLDAVQVRGGYGFTTEYEVERDLRDAVGSTLYSGTSEIQRNLIARSLGL